MSWSKVQRERLGVEKNILEQYFSDKVTWTGQMKSSETRVELALTSNSEKKYKLRLYLHEDFPNSCPHMAIVDPPKLLTKNNKSLPLLDSSFHTLGLTVDGFTKLCHFSPELWTPDNTLFQILMKGIMWIEAYEGHLHTGNSMDHYLGEQKGTANDREDTNLPETKEPRPEAEQCCIL